MKPYGGEMDDKIYILHVIKKMDRGGTEALLINLLRTIDRERFQFDFVVHTDEKCDYDDEIVSLDSKIYHAPSFTGKNIIQYKDWWKKFFIKHPEYSVVHGHTRGIAPFYLSEAKKAKRITIIHCHSNSFGKGLKASLRNLWQIQTRHIADYNFACSYDSGVAQFGKKNTFEVIKNGIQAERYIWNPNTRKTVRDELKVDGQFVVGHVGRFCQEKNHKFLVDIFNSIHKIEKNSVLLLAGRGALEREIHSYVDKLSLSQSVMFLGVRNDIPRLMQAMDAFVLPSLYEGLGIVNIEAQAAGLPCFSSADVVAPESAVTDLMTFIPLSDGPEIWAEKVLSNQILPEDRRNTIDEIRKSGFDIRTTADYLSEFYKRITNKSENDL